LRQRRVRRCAERVGIGIERIGVDAVTCDGQILPCAGQLQRCFRRRPILAGDGKVRS
jgi:hypothetical protein